MEPDAEELEKRLAAATSPLYVYPLVRFEAVQGLARAAAEAIKKNTKPTPTCWRKLATPSTLS
ncbi:hypothetical protein NKH48_19355 [Mesorhizobium sp. M1233]|uniref:hypothetical protein n=1 Tax=Mesorhizobium sp. M1233 TaxID=2957072 RepID=UPI0033358B30